MLMNNILPWFTLRAVPGIGNLLFKRLLDRFGSPQAVLSAKADDLARVDGITGTRLRAVLRQRTPDWVHRILDQVQQKGYQLITLQHPQYPLLLRHIADPPPLLYVYGCLQPDADFMAVVGSRRCTGYGRNTTDQLCGQLASRGVTVVSGMARGIDTAAHKGALGAGGRTVAVLGTGLNRVYPAENLKLFHQIAENGAVISEFDLDARPDPHHFPQRNRIISGMSLGTVVVEAAQRSGSLITARLAAEQGREVFAVPGSIHAATSRGTHDLIRQGAKLVENTDDIFEEFAGFWPQQGRTGSACEPKSPPALTEMEITVFQLVSPYPTHIDDLKHQVGLDSSRLNAILFQLELKGLICQEPGKFFVRHADDNEP
jgi:DNA processing protein